ncbi:MAG TPA: carboxypeptidase regulatory-like domain-containing protein [Terriglobia bacterium]|nr:carboxypeptidase regulatory-like domain-containing protein [Terriglobia bacterium]
MSCKRFDKRNGLLIFVASLLVAFGLSAPLWGQSLTTGAIIGTVTDPTGAVVPNAQITATNTATGASRTTQTGANGSYTVSQLEPGEYKVSVSASGFRTSAVGPVVVSVSHTANADVALEVGAQTQTVEVTGAAQMIETSNPNTTTTVNARALADLPNPGNDLSYVAQIAPGAIMNTGGGYGNMEFNGLPATSTNFTIDGLDANDPFLNLNNSGATNLQLGLNAVDEASVNTLSYSVDQGRSGAAQINYVTKGGTNDWHGNAFETWNGARMNAVDWFVNAQPGAPATRTFDNINQFGGSVGGPIRKNKLFVFGDVEGLRIVLPATLTENYPSQAYENYVFTQLPLAGYDPRTHETYQPPTNPSVAATYYKQAFSLYGNPAGGVPIATSDCPILGDGTIVALAPGVPTPHGTGCRLHRTFGTSNNTHDLFMKYRVDQDINDNNRIWYAFEWEKGVQATITDAVNKVFNDYSTQPQNGLSIGYTHVFSPTLVNEFNPGYYWYSAIFGPTNLAAARAASPYEFTGGSFTPIFGFARSFPQGRNVLDWQLIDNLTWTRGTHTLKFGENLRRSLVSDHDVATYTTPYLNLGNLVQYAQDVLGTFAELGFPRSTSEPIGIADLDMYAQDSWKAKSNLTITYGLRATWNSNPVSQHSHFARLNGSFYDISHDVNQPLNSVILTNQQFELAGTQRIQWQPRAAIAWEIKPKTLFRLGGGLFSDVFPAVLADSMLSNFPNKNIFTAGWAGSGQPIVATYAVPGSGDGVVNSPNNDGLGNIVPANAALLAGFSSGVLSCAAANAPPNCLPGQGYAAVPKGVFKYPYFAEWSATLQQQFGANWIASVQYVGTKATNMPYTVQANGFQTACPGCFTPYVYDPTFNGPDGRFGGVTQYWAGANSIYNGLQATLEKRFGRGLSVRANYTWSHCIDELSNEGAVTGGFDGQSQTSANPGQLYLMRGNCDYDVRNSLNGSWVYQLPSPAHNRFLKQVVNGWQVSGDVFLHTGFPFSVYNQGYGANGNGVFQASAPGGGGFAVPVSGANPYAKWQKLPTQTPGVAEIQWLNPAAFQSVVDPNTGSCTGGETFDPSGNALTVNDNASTCQFGPGGRNNVFGPGFAWTDIFVSKNFKITERVNFRFDLQMYNAFNHMNPGFPGTYAGIQQSSNTVLDAFAITGAVSPPTSLLGSFLGGDNSVRMIALSGRITF